MLIVTFDTSTFLHTYKLSLYSTGTRSLVVVITVVASIFKFDSYMCEEENERNFVGSVSYYQLKLMEW